MYEIIFTCTTKKTNKKSASGERMVEHSPKILASEEKATTTMGVEMTAAVKNKVEWDRVDMALWELRNSSFFHYYYCGLETLR